MKTFISSWVDAPSKFVMHIIRRTYLTILFAVIATSMFSQPVGNGRIPGVNVNGNQPALKWDLRLNSLTADDILGSSNNFSLRFFTNGTEKVVITADGKFILKFFTGNSGIVIHDDQGEFHSVLLDGDETKFLNSSGEFVPLPADIDWAVNGTNLTTIPGGNVGIGTTAPTAKLEVSGNLKASGTASFGNNILIDGTAGKITSATNSIDFGAANLITQGTIFASYGIFTQNFGAGNIGISGNNISSSNNAIEFSNGNLGTINKITANEIVGNTVHAGSLIADNLTLSNPISLQYLDIGDNLTLGGITISGLDNTVISNTGAISFSDNNLQTSGLIIAGKIGVNMDEPVEVLEVMGNAAIHGTLYVDNGIIVGKRVNTERVMTDTLNSTILNVTSKIMADELEVIKPLKIANNFIIDGQNSLFTSTSGLIDFGDDQLHTDGKIRAGVIITSNISTTDFETEYLTLAGGGFQVDGYSRNIMTTDVDLKIQQGQDRNTIINPDGGNVGIGTLTPAEKFSVNGNVLATGNGSFGSMDLTGNLNVGGSIYLTGGGRISSSINEISFYGTNLSYINTLTATAINVDEIYAGTAHYNEFEVENSIKIGANSMYLSSNSAPDGSTTNSIYTTQGSLKIQSEAYTNNTILNLQGGNVGIGKDPAPETKLDIDGDCSLNGHTLYLHNTHHGIAYESSYADASIDGPVVFGWTGGALGTKYFLPEGGPDLENIALSWKRDGKVGVGTGNPLVNFHLKGISYGPSNWDSGPITVIDAGVPYTGTGNPPLPPPEDDIALRSAIFRIEDQVNFTDHPGHGRNVYWDFTASGNTHKFYLSKGGTGDELDVITITEEGLVGIGTTNPYAKLDINGTVRVNDNDIYLRPYNDYNHGLGYYGATWAGTIRSFAGVTDISGPVLYGWSGGALGSRITNDGGITNIEKIALRWDGNGRVGIGTTSPGAKLEVYDNVDGFAGIKINNASESTSGNVQVGIDFYNSSNFHGRIYGDRSTNNFVFRNCQTGSGDIKFQTDDGAKEPLTIKHDGNVGIGITTPEYALDVAGTVRSCEFIAEPNTWCDYVFEKNYNLVSLPELERYILLNKHLPDIPTEKEVLQNGIELGKMNTLLLKKVEELMLYTIEQNKKMEELSKTVFNLQNENVQIKKLLKNGQ